MCPWKEMDSQTRGGGWGRWKYRNIECESILGAGMEVGAVGYRCLRHQQPCQNSATHLRVGYESWYQFNEMERSGPSNFIHVNLTQTQWTSSLGWFFHFKRILSEEPFYYFYSFIFFWCSRNRSFQSIWDSLLCRFTVGYFIEGSKKWNKKCPYLQSVLQTWQTFDSNLGINAEQSLPLYWLQVSTGAALGERNIRDWSERAKDVGEMNRIP